MWLRFETNYRNVRTRWAEGVFQNFWVVEEDEGVEAGVRERVRELHGWFNRHLPVAPAGRVDRRAIFWFRMKAELGVPVKVSPWKRRPLTKLAARVPKVEVRGDRPVDLPVAAEVVLRVRECVGLMERAGVRVRVISTEKPGYVVWEDAYQVAAVPFRDGFEEHEVEEWVGRSGG
ncbi:MAG: hypothetical protein ACTHN5_06975 [Phycisphaerae bacterium]